MRGVAEKSQVGMAACRAAPLRAPCALLAASAFLLALASCTTVPQRSPSEWLGALPPDATLYASFAVAGSTDLIKKALKDAGPGSQDIATLVDMTRRLVCSVTISKGEPAGYSVLALGSYPSGIIGMRLAGNKEWKKASAPSGTFWEWRKVGIQMSIPNNSLLLASNGGIDSLLGRWKSPIPLAVPPDVSRDMQAADLVIYMPELPGGISESAAQKGMRIPIQEVWMNAVKAGGGYDISGTANTGSAQEAKLLTLVLRLGIVAWMKSEKVQNTAEILKSVSLAASGLQVKLSGLHFTDEQIIPLFLSLVKNLSPAEEPAPAPAPIEAAPEASGEP
jgi:hypothetical protein